MFTIEYFVNKFKQLETEILIDKYINTNLSDEAKEAALYILNQRGIPEKSISEMMSLHIKTHETHNSSIESKIIFNPGRIILVIPALTISALASSVRINHSGTEGNIALFVLFFSIIMIAVILFVRNTAVMIITVLFSIVFLYSLSILIDGIATGH